MRRESNDGRSSARVSQWADHVRQDCRHALRMIRRMPGLAVVVVLSLGVGIGVNATVFSWLKLMVLDPIPGVRGGSAFQLVEPRTETGSYPGTSWLEYRDLRNDQRDLRDLIAFRMAAVNVGDADATQRASALLVSGNYFSVLGLRPALGRFIQPGEVSQSGGEPVAVISSEFWQTHFNGSNSAIGKTVRINGRPLTIVGVAPPNFQGTTVGLYFDVWLPATLAPLLFASPELESRDIRGYSVMGMLRPGVTRARAQTGVNGVMRQLARDYPATNLTMRAEVLAFSDAPRGPQRMLVRGLALLQGVMLVLLLAVCGNAANLLLARASARQREMALRLALGSGRGRVASLLLAESLMLAAMGSALGVAIAVWATRALRTISVSGAMPIRFQTSVDGRALAFAIVLGVACGLLFGIVPAVKLSGIDAHRALRAGASADGRSRARNALMATEVGLALVVLVAAGLFFRAFRERERDPGFRREGVLLAAYDLTGRRADTAFSRAFASRLLVRLSALPGVESAAIASSVPLDLHGFPERPFNLEGRARSDAADDRALVNIVTPGYFNTMAIPLRVGAPFADLDDAAAAPQAIVNEEFVRRYIGNAQPLGRRIQGRDTRYVIVGVARNALYDSFGEPPTPIIYYSYRDRPLPTGEIHLRTRPGAEGALAPEVQRVIRELDPMLPVYDVRTLSEHVEKNLFLRRMPARLFAVLGPLLLIMAAIGIYAIVAYSVSRRTTEIGVRLALGASGGHVVVEIMRDTLRVVTIGALSGWLVAYVAQIHIARGAALDLPVFLGVPALLLCVAALACWVPARRAAAVDPMVALREV